MPKDKVDQLPFREPIPVVAHKIHGIPTLEPDRYHCLRVYSGKKVGPSSVLRCELFADDVAGKNWETIGQELRQRFGNKDMHVRCYGGPLRVEWFMPRKYSRFENVEDAGVALGAIDTMADEVFTLKQQLKKSEEIIKELRNGTIGPNTQNAIRDLLGGVSTKNDEYDDEDDEPEEKNVIMDFFTELITEHKPLLKFGISQMLSGMMNTPTTQQPTQQHTHFADPPMDAQPQQPNTESANIGSDFEVALPAEVFDFFARVDWDRTKYIELVNMLEQFAPKLGIVMLTPPS